MGATIIPQDATLKPARPCSAMVGTSGSTSERLALAMARARSWPFLTRDSTGGTNSKPRSMSPALKAVATAAAVLKGTMVKSTLACCLNSSALRCWVVPSRLTPTMQRPFFSWAVRMKSSSWVSGESLRTSSRTSLLLAMEMGAKLASMS
ncbi:hypothetical protein D3C78_1328900 [compost metagenome]